MRPTAPPDYPDYPDDPVAEPVHKGRGALSNETSRSRVAIARAASISEVAVWVGMGGA